MIGLFSDEEGDFSAVYADLTDTDLTLGSEYQAIGEIFRINEEGQFVIYIQDLDLEDEYSISVFYTVTWENEDGVYTSLNVVSEDVPVPASAYVAA
jgi:hypothetical protein